VVCEPLPGALQRTRAGHARQFFTLDLIAWRINQIEKEGAIEDGFPTPGAPLCTDRVLFYRILVERP
jgi:hypothetical protein